MKRGIWAGMLALAVLLVCAAVFWKQQRPGTSGREAGGEDVQMGGEAVQTDEETVQMGGEAVQAGEETVQMGGEDVQTGEETVQACVAIRVGQGGPDVLAASGSGVILEVSEDMLWIVTAGHVLGKAGAENPVYVDFPALQASGEDMTVQCADYVILADDDLAFLRVGREELPEKLWGSLGAAGTDKESYDGLKASDSVHAMGYQGGVAQSCEGVLEESWIYVEDFAQYMILAECRISPGMSGGGLFDGEGYLIGIVCGGNGQGEIVAVPLHVVQARLADLE